MTSLPSRLIGGRYKVVRKLAEGGMGEVFEAQHNLSKKRVALKILFPHIGKDEAARQRFLREVSAPAQIGHEGIVEVYDAGFDTADGSLFVAMEFIDGEPMRERLARGGVDLVQLLDWFEEMLDPLAAAHRAGIVHRDLKPENVMLARKRDGEVIKLLDFGIARDLDGSKENVTHTGIAMGTPHYMAPEQAMSAKGVSPAADVWAMGVMLYEALGGRPPFDGETASAIVVFACTNAHAPLAQLAPHVPAPLSTFVDRCLEKDPNHRPKDAGAMLAELRQVRLQLGHGGRAAQIPAGSQSTGPMGMTPQPTPSGTTALPASQLPSAGGWTPAPGGGFAASDHPAAGYASPAPGYVTPPGSSPGYGTPPPSSFGTNPGFASGPGAYSAPGGYGSQVASLHGQPSGGGGRGRLALAILAVVLLGGLVLVGGAIAAGVYLLSEEEGEGQGWSSTGDVTVSTDVPSAELLVDGTSRGAVASGQVLRVRAGAHRFELRENGVVVADGTLTVQAGDTHTITLNRTAQPPPNDPNAMMPGNVQTYQGQLRPGDTQQPDGKYYDTFTFAWTAGARVRIDMDSNSGLDTYLILRSPSGVEQVNDDRAGGNFNSTLDVVLSETGTYTVIATSFSANATGDYVLSVRGP